MGVESIDRHHDIQAQFRGMTPPDSPQDENQKITLPPIASLVSKSNHLHMHLDFIAPGSRSQSPVGGLGALSVAAAIARGSRPISPLASTSLVSVHHNAPSLQLPRVQGPGAIPRQERRCSQENSFRGPLQRYLGLQATESTVWQPIPVHSGLPSPLHSSIKEGRLPSPTESVCDATLPICIQPQHQYQGHNRHHPYSRCSPETRRFSSDRLSTKSLATRGSTLPPVNLPSLSRMPRGSQRDHLRSPASRGGSRNPGLANRSAAPRNERYPYDREERYALVYLRRTDVSNKLEWKDVVARYALLFPPGTTRRYKEPEVSDTADLLSHSTTTPKITGIPPWYPEREMQGLQCRLYRVRNDEGLAPCRDANASLDALGGEGAKQLLTRETEILAQMAVRDRLDDSFLRRVQEIASLPAGSI